MTILLIKKRVIFESVVVVQIEQETASDVPAKKANAVLGCISGRGICRCHEVNFSSFILFCIGLMPSWVLCNFRVLEGFRENGTEGKKND